MYRIEQDGLGEIELPKDAVYGAQTQRAIENFPISGISINQYPEIINALAMVKKACALANKDCGVLGGEKSDVIQKICDEIMTGSHHEHFVVDLIQGGAGTSTNMNANEVIANLGIQQLGAKCGDYSALHPNDDVNRSQSTNDVYPTAIRLATLAKLKPLLESMRNLVTTFSAKAVEFDAVMKVGRTQLQDAVPMSVGREFKSYATTIGEDMERIQEIGNLLTEINLGGTAIGTSINTPDGYRDKAVKHLTAICGFDLKQSKDLIEASSDVGAFVLFSGVLKRVAIKLSKICNDLRLLSSGPRAGFGELNLPPVQAGSSIMPGKINPVIPEVVNQVCYQAIGNDLTVTFAAEAGQLQLNAMEPIIFAKVMETINSLVNAMNILTTRCVAGITVNTDRCASTLENSLVLATSLTPFIGYDEASRIAKIALAEGMTLRKATEINTELSKENIESVFGIATK